MNCRFGSIRLRIRQAAAAAIELAAINGDQRPMPLQSPLEALENLEC